MNNGVVPSGWTEKPLGKVADIVRDSVLPHDIVSGTSYVGLEHIDGEGRFVGVQSVSNGELASNKFAFSDQHILYGKLRPYLRKIARPSFSGVCSTDILPLRPLGEVDRGYLFHYLRQQHLVDLATTRSTGANLPRLSPKQLDVFPVIYPPLPEQRRIAAILDMADTIRRKREEGTRLTEELLRSTFLEMLGDPATNPKKWDVVPLGTVAYVTKLAGYEYTKFFKYLQEGEVIAIRAINVKRGRLRLEDVHFIDRDVSDALPRSKLHQGDIVMTYIGVNIGDTAYVPESGKYHLAPNVAKISANQESLNPLYLMQFLELFREELARRATSTAKAAFNMSNIRGVKLPLPPIHFQKKFADAYRSIQRNVDDRKIACVDSGNLFGSLVQRAFRGLL